MNTFAVLMLISLFAALCVGTSSADCVTPEHTYDCNDRTDDEAIDLTCTECYPQGEKGHYNCSCWANPPRELEGPVYRTCQDALRRGKNKSGVFNLKPNHLDPFQAYCDMETDGGGWTVIQRRMDGSEDFFRWWDEYVRGFGDVSGEHWLGLSKIYRLANGSVPQRLRVDLESFEDERRYAVYSSFLIGGRATLYEVHIKGYGGNAGDAMSYNSGRRFTTKHWENDEADDLHCGQYSHSGWWHNACTYANLNGRYYDSATCDHQGIYWSPWLGNQCLKSTVMMVRAGDE